MTTTPEQIEAVARAIANDDDWWEDYTLYAERAISAMRPFIRSEALEEAAKMCEECPLYDEDGVDWNTDPQVTLAAAIRALKEKKDV
jgi:hypothetical protein